MTIFKLMLTLLKREWKNMVFYVIVFFVFAVLNTQSAANNTFSLQSYSVAYVEEDKGSDQGLYDYLKEHHQVEKVELSPLEIREYALLNRYDAILISKKEGFSAVASPYTPVGYSVVVDADTYLRYEKILGKGEKLDQLMSMDVPIHMEKKEEDSFVDNWIKFYFKYSGYIFMAIGILVVGQSMIDLTKEEVYLRIKVSPYSSAKVYMESLLALLVSLLFFILFLMTGGSLVIKTPIFNKETIALLPGVLLLGISSMTLAMLVASAFKSKVVVAGVSTTLSLMLSFISGVFVPSPYLPASVVTLSKLFPMYYYVQYIEKQRFVDLAMMALFILVYALLGIFITRERRKA